MPRSSLFGLLVVVLLCFAVQRASARADHTFEAHDPVDVYVNQISPLENPSETYAYYELPFPCKPTEESGVSESLGEVLEGDTFFKSAYDIRFLDNVEYASLCGKQQLSAEQVAQFLDAVKRFFTFSMAIDELPVGGYVGYSDAETADDGSEFIHYYLNTHLHFSFGVNQNQIVEVNITVPEVEGRTELPSEGGLEVDLTYSVSWQESSVTFASRLGHQNEWLLSLFSVYDPQGPADIRWISILNAFALIVFLVLFIALIMMRILKRDYSRLEKLQQSQEDMDDAEDDIGWKRIHTEVFRYPRVKSLFASMVGVGVQFICLIFSLVFLVVMGVFSDYHRGYLVTTAIVLYALTSAIAGYMSAAWYKRMGGEAWLRNLLLTVALFGIPFWIIGAFLNFVAVGYHSTQALPVGTVFLIIGIWFVVSLPLAVIGGILGRRFAQPFKHPTQTKLLPKSVPSQSWFQALPVQLVISGFLPFSAIYLELYYIFSSVWGHRLYTLYSVLFLAFIVLVVVTACITICLVYFQLAAEDYNWWWRSMLCGGSASLFVFLYSVYFYVYQSQMSGFLQASFYFGNVMLVCYAFFIMLGAVGYFSAHMFVHRIYSAVKTQ